MATKQHTLRDAVDSAAVRNLSSAMYSTLNSPLGLKKPVTYVAQGKQFQCADLEGPINYQRIMQGQLTTRLQGALRESGHGKLADLVSGNLEELALLTEENMKTRTVSDVIEEAAKYGMDVSAIKKYVGKTGKENYKQALERLEKAKDQDSQELLKNLIAAEGYTNTHYTALLDKVALDMNAKYLTKRQEAKNAPKDSELGKVWETLSKYEKAQETVEETKGRFTELQRAFGAGSNYVLEA